MTFSGMRVADSETKIADCKKKGLRDDGVRLRHFYNPYHKKQFLPPISS